MAVLFGVWFVCRSVIESTTSRSSVQRFLQTATPVPTWRPRTDLVEDLAADSGPRKTPEAG